MTIDDICSEIKRIREEKREEIMEIFKTRYELIQKVSAPNKYKLEALNQRFQECAGYMTALHDILILIDKGVSQDGR